MTPDTASAPIVQSCRTSRVETADLAAEYLAGATVHEIARRHRMNHNTVVKRLRAFGTPLRAARQRPRPCAENVSPIVKTLAKVTEQLCQADLCKRAGVSPEFWREARGGRKSPGLGMLESLAEAAGYELVLRRRMR